MPDQVQYNITISANAATIVRSYQTMPQWMVVAIVKVMDVQNQITVSHIQSLYLSFPSDGPTVPIGCRHMTGRLRQSLRNSPAVPSGNGVKSSIGSNVVYAAPQEFGADIPAQTITPKKGKALRFMIGDRVVFAKKVELPARHLEGRGFVRRGIQDRLPKYSAALGNAIVRTHNQNSNN